MTDLAAVELRAKLDRIAALPAECVRTRLAVLATDYVPFPGEREAIARRAARLGIEVAE